ncbi:MAG: deoxyribodipyrimidine photo-lyase, partial [Akkermansiaceae bacterium]
MSSVIHWFRRDLRIADNSALYHASKAGGVIPVYILSDWKKNHAWTGSNRQKFLCGCLESLSKNLETLDSTLIIREGNAISVLKK